MTEITITLPDELLKSDAVARTFLESYTKPNALIHVGHACKAAGLTRREYLARRQEDPLFNEACTQIEDEVRDAIEHTLLDHAINGVIKPVYRRDKNDEWITIDHVREYDHKLLCWLAERAMPDKYGPDAKKTTRDELAGPGEFRFELGDGAKGETG